MEDQDSPLSWGYYYKEEGIEELKHSLLYTSLELEATLLSAHEELARKDDELMHFKTLLTNTIKERDKTQAKCQRLMLDKLILQQQLQPYFLLQPELASIEGEPRGGGESNTLFSSSDCDEPITASPGKDPIPPPALPPPAPAEVAEKLVLEKRLPEKGKFLEAVLEAGPLLQTLLLAGPLPQWQHPPPQLNSIEIPPVTLSSPKPMILHQDSCVSSSGCFNKKRGQVNSEGYELSPKAKNQKMVHQSSMTNI
ncbi:unnamed protein product [Ilex paraguariensis]|uniref:Uncharacterized protein n=1 Tax=Ilex paraguariensis TaxID=185542 RepID=A0ABC8V0B4_9AQUA